MVKPSPYQQYGIQVVTHYMDQARTIIDKVKTPYYYHEFAVLSYLEIKRLRPYLHCHSCNAKVNFISESKSGAQAYFRLHQGEAHRDGCDEIKYDTDTYKTKVKQEDERLQQEVEKIKNDTNIIDIVLSSEAQFEGQEEAAENVKPKANKKVRSINSVSKTHTIDSDKVRSSEKSLIQLLKYCMRTTKLLANSEIAIKFKGRKYKVNDSIYNFFEIANIPNPKRPYFFWGSVKYVKDLQFLNIGQGERGSVVIDDSIKDELWQKMRVDKHWQLVGCNIICFGWANKKGNLTYIQVKNISDIGFMGIKSNELFAGGDTEAPVKKIVSNIDISSVPETKSTNDLLSRHPPSSHSKYDHNLEHVLEPDKEISSIVPENQSQPLVRESYPQDISSYDNVAEDERCVEMRHTVVTSQKRTLWKKIVRLFTKIT